MNELTPNEAAKIAFRLLQVVREHFEDQKQLTASAVATLLCSLAEGSVQQAELPGLVKNIDQGGLSKQLDVFEGRRKVNPKPALILRHVDDTNRRHYIVETTTAGNAFKRQLASVANKELASIQKSRDQS